MMCWYCTLIGAEVQYSLLCWLQFQHPDWLKSVWISRGPICKVHHSPWCDSHGNIRMHSFYSLVYCHHHNAGQTQQWRGSKYFCFIDVYRLYCMISIKFIMEVDSTSPSNEHSGMSFNWFHMTRPSRGLRLRCSFHKYIIIIIQKHFHI